MSSLRNAISRRAQPQARKKFGILEKHKDYVARAQAFHKKEDALRKLKEKAAFRNPDEFYFNMVKTRTVDGVHKPESEANKYTQEELMLMKTQDIGYILQKLQSEKKKIGKFTGMLQSLDNQSSNRHVYYAEDRHEYGDLLGRLRVCTGPVPGVEGYRRPRQFDRYYHNLDLQAEPRLCGLIRDRLGGPMYYTTEAHTEMLSTVCMLRAQEYEVAAERTRDPAYVEFLNECDVNVFIYTKGT